MEVVKIPEEVIGGNVLEYLNWNDLLRLRRVSKWTLSLTNSYLRDNPNRAPEIEINATKEKSFGAFISLRIPTTKLFLNLSFGPLFHQIDEKTIQQFMKDYGPLIQHLRVTQLTLYPSGLELAFLEALPNLKTFEAISLGYHSEKIKLISFHAPFPSTFSALESIKIGQDPEDQDSMKTIDHLNQYGLIYYYCPQLKHTCLPFSPVDFEDGHDNDVLTRDLLYLYDYLASGYQHQLPLDFYPEEGYPEDLTPALESQLKVIDFANYRFPYEDHPWDQELIRSALSPIYTASIDFFLNICIRALNTGIQLVNVNPMWFCGRWNTRNADYAHEALGHPIVSLTNMDSCVASLEMPNLEKLVIPFSSRCVTGRVRREWPSLKYLDVGIDGQIGRCWDLTQGTRFKDIKELSIQSTEELFNFLFGRYIVREQLTDLTLRFKEGDFNSRLYVAPGPLRMKFQKGVRKLVAKVAGDVAVPETGAIVASCPNLRRIKLVNWQGKGKDLWRFWRGLRRLDEVELEDCEGVGDAVFFGEVGSGRGDGNPPVFLGLKKLKKLTLRGLDQMPNITDRVFSQVLSKMKLKELVLTSNFPVENVTKVGIKALLKGPFAGTIEKFGFRDWSMAGLSVEEFEKLGKKFRSYKML